MAGAVSDYGVTRYTLLYRGMAVLLGAGAILLALALGHDTDANKLEWLWVYGLSRVAIAGFMTDRPGRPVSTEGRIHWALAAAAFTAIAIAATSIDWTGAPGALGPLGEAVAVSAIATLGARLIGTLRPVFGLAERALYVTSILWLVIAAADLA